MTFNYIKMYIKMARITCKYKILTHTMKMHNISNET